MELARAVDNDQHAVAGVGGLFTRSQIRRDGPIKELSGRRNPFNNGIVGGNAIARGAMAENETDSDSIGIMVFWIPCDLVRLALSHGLQ